jgi:glycosyltransferase involved in cell wall biosynthesis
MARLLFVASRLPWPPREGHQLRSWHLLRAAARAHEVHLLCLKRADEGEPQRTLHDTVASVTTVPLPALRDPLNAVHAAWRWLAHREPPILARYDTAALRRAFARLVRGVDLVHLDILAVAGLRDLVPRAMPVVLDEHNVESALLQARAAIEPARWRRTLLHWQARAVERFEAAACGSADRVLACSDDDARRLRTLAAAARIDTVPNGVDLQAFPSFSDVVPSHRTLVFVGQMSWFPNRDGIADFMQHTLPRIRERCDARLQVIGHRGDMQAPAAVAEAVEFTGFVDDLRPLVRDAAVYVVPLRAGSGTRLKILEAMAMGKAIVSTRIGAEGIGLRHEETALLADTPEDFTAAVCRLLGDAPLRQRLGAAARRAAERDYGWDAIGARLLRIYSEVLGGSRQE